MNRLKLRISIYIYLYIYKMILDIILLKFIEPIFGYMAIDIQINSMKILEGCVYLLLIAGTINFNKEKLSTYFNWLLVIIIYIPLLSIYGLTNENRSFMIFATISFLIIFKMTKIRMKLILPSIKSKKYIIFIVIGISILLYIFIYFKIGFSLTISLENIYSTRKEFTSLMQGSGIFIYLFVWQGNVFNMFLLSYSISAKKYKYTVIVVLMQLLLFSSNGSKSTLFSQCLGVAIYIFYKYKYKLVFMIKGILGIQGIAILMYFFTNSVDFLGILSHRLLYVPAQIAFFHYDFFYEHGNLKLAHSILSGIVPYKYNIEPSRIIGVEYFGSINMNANTNFLGDSYMNFGLIGMIIFSILLGLIFICIDSISENKDKGICLCTCIIPIFSLTNGALLTTILTYGLGVSIIIIILLPNNNFKKQI